MSVPAGLSLGSAAAEALMEGHDGDPDLAPLETFLNIASAQTWCRRYLPAQAGVDPESLSQVRPLRYRTGRRCTFLLEFTRPRATTLYAKLFRAGRSRRVAMRHMILSAHELPGLQWPRVLAHVEDCAVVILSHVPGASLVEIMTDNVRDVPAICRTVGAQLAGFHRLAQAGVGGSLPRRSLLDELADVRKLYPLDSTAVGMRSEDMDSLLAGVEPILAGCRIGEDVLLHRDLHPQQILVGRQGVGLVDLDNLAMGPAEIDLGNLLAHFDLLEIHHSAPGESLQPAGQEMLAAYLDHGEAFPETVNILRAVALLRLGGLYGSSASLPSISWGLLERARQLLAGDLTRWCSQP